MMSIFGIIMNGTINAEIKNNPKINMDMMNKVINPDLAKGLPTELLPMLRNVLYNALHNIYIGGFILIVLALVINMFDRKKLK